MKKSFTLLEILVVIIIIGIIASMTFVSLNGTRAKSRDAKRISDIRQIQSALEMYRNDNNTYPQYVTPGNALVGAINGQTYMKQIPTAPGKNDGSCSSDTYSYTPDNSNTSYHITYCLGGAVQSAGPSSCEAVPGNICNVSSGGGGGGGVPGTQCVQESANVATACGGLGTGTYTYSIVNNPIRPWVTASLVSDGDWGTWSISDSSSYNQYAYFDVVYYKPAGALSTSVWVAKHAYATVTKSIPVACWNAYGDRLLFRVTSDDGSGDQSAYGSCWNGSGWTIVFTSMDYGVSNCGFYEESMTWQY